MPLSSQITFIDSNIFIARQLTRSRDLLQMAEMARESSTPLVTSDIVRSELITWCVRDVQQKLGKVRESVKNLNNFISVSDRIMPLLQNSFDGEKFVDKFLESLEVVVLPYPKTTDLTDLVNKSISHVPPFSEGDKGLQDYLVFETAMTAYSHFGCSEILFLSKDAVFIDNESELRGRLPHDGLEVKFASDIETASGYLKGKIEESVWVKKQAERDSLYSRIVKSQDKIFDFIRDKLEVTEDGVLGRLFGGASLSRNQDIPSGALLRRLRAIKPISIDRELFGMFRDMGYDDENTITIWVSAELDVLIDIPLEPFSFFGPAQQVNAGEVDFSKVSRFSFPGKYEQKSLKIDRKVSVKLRVDPDTNTPIEILSATLP